MSSEAIGRSPLWLKILVGALLAVHTAWIGTHLWLVAGERINPWKLGGYGMYTVPHPFAVTHVFVFDDAAGRWMELARDQANSFGFDTGNHLHVFRCRVPSEASILAFMNENPHLRYRPLTIGVSEQVFLREPIRSQRRIHAKIEIAWAGRTRFGYRGEVCDQSFAGEVLDYSPPA